MPRNLGKCLGFTKTGHWLFYLSLPGIDRRRFSGFVKGSNSAYTPQALILSSSTRFGWTTSALRHRNFPFVTGGLWSTSGDTRESLRYSQRPPQEALKSTARSEEHTSELQSLR